MASMYQISVSVYIRRLDGLAGCLKKAQAHYAEKKYDETSLMKQRLFPDMYPFARQVQVATDHARASAALLAGLEPPTYEADEKTIAELIARVERSVAYLNTFKPEQIDGSEGKTITVKRGGADMSFSGLDLLLHSSMSNFYFHTTTAYAILRSNGVPLIKRDFSGPA